MAGPGTIPPKISDFVLYAERSVYLGEQNKVADGDIGIHAIAVASFGTQLKVGVESSVEGCRLYSPSVSLGRNVAAGIIQTNWRQDDGIPLGSLAPFPAAVMPPLPLVPAFQSGGSDVSVEQGQTVASRRGNTVLLSWWGEHCN